MKTTTKILLVLVGVIAVFWILSAIGNQAKDNQAAIIEELIANPNINKQAVLLCEDCAEEGILINLWDSPKKQKVLGSVPHLTEVTITAADSLDGVIYYKVRGSGLFGWISEPFVHIDS